MTKKTHKAPEALAAEPVAEAHAAVSEVAEDALAEQAVATHALMAHPDNGVTDAFPVEPTTGSYFVPFDQISKLLEHGFEVVGQATPQIWAAPVDTSSVTLSIGELPVIDGLITVPADIADGDRQGLAHAGFTLATGA